MNAQDAHTSTATRAQKAGAPISHSLLPGNPSARSTLFTAPSGCSSTCHSEPVANCGITYGTRYSDRTSPRAGTRPFTVSAATRPIGAAIAVVSSANATLSHSECGIEDVVSASTKFASPMNGAPSQSRSVYWSRSRKPIHTASRNGSTTTSPSRASPGSISHSGRRSRRPGRATGTGGPARRAWPGSTVAGGTSAALPAQRRLDLLVRVRQQPLHSGGVVAAAAERRERLGDHVGQPDLHVRP